MKAKLIKQEEIKKTRRQEGLENLSIAKPKTAAAVAREWVGQHQKVQKSARQAFAALFVEPDLRNAT